MIPEFFQNHKCLDKTQWGHKEKDLPQIIIIIKFQNASNKTKILKAPKEGK